MLHRMTNWPVETIKTKCDVQAIYKSHLKLNPNIFELKYYLLRYDIIVRQRGQSAPLHDFDNLCFFVGGISTSLVLPTTVVYADIFCIIIHTHKFKKKNERNYLT